MIPESDNVTKATKFHVEEQEESGEKEHSVWTLNFQG